MPIPPAAHYNRIYSTPTTECFIFNIFSFCFFFILSCKRNVDLCRRLQMLFLVCLRVWDINLYKQISRKPSQMKLSTYTRRYSDYHIYILHSRLESPYSCSIPPTPEQQRATCSLRTNIFCKDVGCKKFLVWSLPSCIHCVAFISNRCQALCLVRHL